MNATHSPEEWRAVPGSENYEVSNLGRARRLDHLGADGRRLQGRPMNLLPTPTGYLQVHVGGSKRYIHRLVLEAFVGPCPDGMEACHNDGDRSNNTPGNLRWDTRLGNCQDIIAHGTHANLQKTHCPRGHEYDGWANGWKSALTGQRKKRICRTCRRERHNAAYRARRAAALTPARSA